MDLGLPHGMRETRAARLTAAARPDLDIAPVARKINREIVLLAGFARAILMQLAHPLVAAGVAEHSTFATGAAGYLRRSQHTIGAMLALTYGTETEARAVLDRINAVHERVQGVLREPAGIFPAGTVYSARDPKLLLWVLATLLDSLPRTYEVLVGPLSAAEKTAYIREAAPSAVLLGIPERLLFSGDRELQAYLDEMLASGEIAVSATARVVARELLAPPFGPARLLLPPARLLVIGLLPPLLRAGYGFRWTARRERWFRRTVAAVRALRAALPPAWREWPAARRAVAAA
ncbi:MAG TPA: oxygenase MpaB family protein [Vicinamibacterales bacterium]|nr:oxygenase MpaB family protein [Vicinamibacterales bacterium]